MVHATLTWALFGCFYLTVFFFTQTTPKSILCAPVLPHQKGMDDFTMCALHDGVLMHYWLAQSVMMEMQREMLTFMVA